MRQLPFGDRRLSYACCSAVIHRRGFDRSRWGDCSISASSTPFFHRPGLVVVFHRTVPVPTREADPVTPSTSPNFAFLAYHDPPPGRVRHAGRTTLRRRPNRVPRQAAVLRRDPRAARGGAARPLHLTRRGAGLSRRSPEPARTCRGRCACFIGSPESSMGCGDAHAAHVRTYPSGKTTALPCGELQRVGCLVAPVPHVAAGARRPGQSVRPTIPLLRA